MVFFDKSNDSQKICLSKYKTTSNRQMAVVIKINMIFTKETVVSLKFEGVGESFVENC